MRLWRVLPLVAALEATCDAVEVAGPMDHRALGHGCARPGRCSGAWLTPGRPAQLAAIGLGPRQPADRQLQVGGRPLWAMATDDHGRQGEHDGPGENLVHLDFAELCEFTTSPGDLLERADRARRRSSHAALVYGRQSAEGPVTGAASVA